MPPDEQTMPSKTRKNRVALERDKLRNTSHWDLDYLPLHEVEALFAGQARHRNDAGPVKRPGRSISRRVLGLLCVAAGLGFLAVALIAARFYAT